MKIDLPAQIASVRQAINRMPSTGLDATVDTLEWLHANEARIKAKVEQPTELSTTTSGRTYKQKFTAHIDFDRGSWQSSYEIFDDAGLLIGFKHVGRDKRKSETYQVFIPFGSQEFKSAKEFIAAYEAGAWKPRLSEAA